MNHLKRIRTLLPKTGADALLLSSASNCFYALSYAFEGYLLITPERAFLLTDFRYEEAARAVAGEDFTVIAKLPHTEVLKSLMEEHEIKSLGIETGRMSCDELNRLKEALHFEAVPLLGLLEECRTAKEPEEIVCIKKAQELADLAFSHILTMLTPSMTEKDVALELEYAMRKAGADGISFPIIAVSGSASSLPHGSPRALPLQKGFLTMDFGAKYGGYCSDMTRTVVLGSASAEMKRLYQTVLDAQRAGIERIKAGVPGSEVDAAARELIEGAGYHGAFGHGFGHGVGIDIHENPRLSASATACLPEGAVVTAEPGIYLPGFGGCRIENMGLVTRDGFENFTASGTELLELF